MAVTLVVLVAVLPPLLLLLGVGLGVAGARWWAARQVQRALLALQAPGDEEAAACACDVATAVPSTTSTAALPPGRKDSRAKLLTHGIHIVASSASLQLPSRSAPSSEAGLPLGLRLASASPTTLRASPRRQRPRPAALQVLPHAVHQPESPADVEAQQLCSLVGPGSGGGGSGSLGAFADGSGNAGPRGLGHSKTASMDLSQLVRAGPSVISQVMEDWDARSTLYRIMSLDTFNMPSPQQQQAAAAAAAGLLSPAAAALLSPAVGGTGGGGSGGGGMGPPLAVMPSGEVHMDEIDLMECIGKGGYGCVYKASWRGAGVAVKYIVCPTDDADSLGRAIREVLLSKKMSHPNVVQCYAWTVLSEPDSNGNSATHSSRSGLSSPREQSFTSRRRQLLTGRSSLELLRPPSGSLAGGATGTPGGARRGLDLRFNAVAGSGAMPHATSSSTLHRITERPALEGSTQQQEVEAALWLPRVSAGMAQAGTSDTEEAASPLAAPHAGAGALPVAAAQAGLPSSEARPATLGPQPTGEVVEELVAEAAAELCQQQQAADHSRVCSDSSGQQSPYVLAPAAMAAGFASSKQLKLQLPLPPSSRSPSTSPGIQAVHVHEAAGGSDTPVVVPAEAATPAGEAGPSAAPSPDQYRVDACSVEPASMPPSPFAAAAAQVQPLQRTSTSDAAGHAPWQLQLLPSPETSSAAAQQAQYVHEEDFDGGEEDGEVEEEDDKYEDEDVYDQFASYEEMVAHFQKLAAEGRLQEQGAEEGEEAAGGEGEHELAVAPGVEEMGRAGSLRNDGADNFTVTAASSFSDVLSISGFMLEGTASGAELATLSLPSSPRFGGSGQLQQHSTPRSGQGSWLHNSMPTSAAASHPAIARSASAMPAPGNLSRLARAASAAPAVPDRLSLKEQLAARMPNPAWPAARAAALGSAGVEQRMQGSDSSLCPPLPEGSEVGEEEALEAAAASTDEVVEVEAEAETYDLHEQQATSSGDQEEQLGQQVCQPTGTSSCSSSQEQPAVECSMQQVRPARPLGSAARHSSTVSLSVWQPVAAGGAPALAEGMLSRTAAQSRQQPQPGISTQAVEGPVSTAATVLEPGPGRGAIQQQQQQPSLLRPALGGGSGLGGGGAGSVTPRLCSLSNLGVSSGTSPVLDGSLQVTPRQQSMPGCGALQQSLRADSVRSTGRPSGRRRVEELREEAAAAFSGGSSGALDGMASCDRLSLGSHNHSFNSEEGFGSPVKQRCGGVRDVFQLEELQLLGQEALMVVVMEFCDLGSLRKALKRKAFRPSAKWPFQTTYRALLRTAQEVAKGMGYIHEFNIVHGDLKPGNVLLKTHKVDRRGYIAKVSDFGLSRPLDCDQTHATLGSALGTIAYTAPETFALNCVKKPSDVYAFGIMLWEMFYCRDPYEGLLDGQICVGVTDGSLRPEFEEDCPEPYRRLAERCWDQDPAMRPSFEQVDRELVRIEMEFRLRRHRAASKRASSSAASAAGGSSMPASRPGSPGVQPRSAAGGAGGGPRQFQASALAD